MYAISNTLCDVDDGNERNETWIHLHVFQFFLWQREFCNTHTQKQRISLLLHSFVGVVHFCLFVYIVSGHRCSRYITLSWRAGTSESPKFLWDYTYKFSTFFSGSEDFFYSLISKPRKWMYNRLLDSCVKSVRNSNSSRTRCNEWKIVYAASLRLATEVYRPTRIKSCDCIVVVGDPTHYMPIALQAFDMTWKENTHGQRAHKNTWYSFCKLYAVIWSMPIEKKT